MNLLIEDSIAASPPEEKSIQLFVGAPRNRIQAKHFSNRNYQLELNWKQWYVYWIIHKYMGVDLVNTKCLKDINVLI